MRAADFHGRAVRDADGAAGCRAPARRAVGAERRQVERARHYDDIARSRDLAIEGRKIAGQSLCQAAADAQRAISQIVRHGLIHGRGRIVHDARGVQSLWSGESVVARKGRCLDPECSSGAQNQLAVSGDGKGGRFPGIQSPGNFELAGDADVGVQGGGASHIDGEPSEGRGPA